MHRVDSAGRSLLLLLSLVSIPNAPAQACPLIPPPLTTPQSVPEGRSILLEWQRARAARSYDVEIASDAGFGTVVDTANVTLRSYAAGGLTPGWYWWHVRSVTAAGPGAWSPTLSFRVEVFPQAFAIDGNRIEDESGDPIVLRGMSSMDPVLKKHSEWPEWDGVWSADEFAAMSAWGAQIVRLPVHPIGWRDYGEAEALSVLDQTITWAAAQGMYVIIDFHSIGWPPTETYDDSYGDSIYLTSKAEIEDFWRAVSTRYAGDDRVAFYEVYNEPVNLNSPDHIGSADDWETWRIFVEEVIDVIRTNDPNKPILINGLQWGYDLSFVAANPVNRASVVYGTHPYPHSDWRIGWDDAFGTLSEAYPVMVTEFGFGNEMRESQYSGEGRYRTAIREYLGSKGISWACWAFSPHWTPRLLRKWDGYKPSSSGKFFRSWMLHP